MGGSEAALTEPGIRSDIDENLSACMEEDCDRSVPDDVVGNMRPSSGSAVEDNLASIDEDQGLDRGLSKQSAATLNSYEDSFESLYEDEFEDLEDEVESQIDEESAESIHMA